MPTASTPAGMSRVTVSAVREHVVYPRSKSKRRTGVLGVPVIVPEPGEYVALGAARQASSAITG